MINHTQYSFGFELSSSVAIMQLLKKTTGSQQLLHAHCSAAILLKVVVQGDVVVLVGRNSQFYDSLSVSC